MWGLVRLVVRRLFDVRVSGLEHWPPPPFQIVANHHNGVRSAARDRHGSGGAADHVVRPTRGRLRPRLQEPGHGLLRRDDPLQPGEDDAHQRGARRPARLRGRWRAGDLRRGAHRLPGERAAAVRGGCRRLRGHVGGAGRALRRSSAAPICGSAAASRSASVQPIATDGVRGVARAGRSSSGASVPASRRCCPPMSPGCRAGDRLLS